MNSAADKTPPLSAATLQILLALAAGDLHGYGIIKEVARNSDGHYTMGPGTLYDNLKKLLNAGLVADVPITASAKRRLASEKEEDRRFFTLTKQGRETLIAEGDRFRASCTAFSSGSIRQHSATNSVPRCSGFLTKKFKGAERLICSSTG
jgi:DNA-binding PadR family transcriptional regulator